jgi:hypothetical protein
MDESLAGAIAADPARVVAAWRYWVAAMVALDTAYAPVGVGGWLAESTIPDFPWRADAVRLAEALPNVALAGLPSVADRRDLTNSGDEENMVSVSGCLLSVAEIARALGVSGAEAVRGAVDLFRELALAPRSLVLNTDVVAVGIRAARELVEVARRLAICRGNARESGVPVPELLALFRQEGGLAVAPARGSFAHAPVIRTHDARGIPYTGCRNPKVIFSDPTAERPGFNLVFRHTLGLTRKMTPKVKLIATHLLTAGGLDSIAYPPLAAADELKALVSFNLSGFGTVPFSNFVAHYLGPLSFDSAVEKARFVKLLTGILMSRLDAFVGPVDLDAVAAAAGSETDALFATHDYEIVRRNLDLDLHLVEGEYGSAAATCLRVQARWYAGRARPVTLLAMADRTPALAGLPVWSPFVAYLRYNVGEATFVGILLRLLAGLKGLDAHLRANRGANGDRVRDALARSTWSDVANKPLAGALADHWRPNVQVNDTWRHIGLIGAVAAGGWKYGLPATPAADPLLLRSARVVRDVLDAVAGQNLVETVNLALEFTPIGTLIDLGLVQTGRQPLRNAHGFTRLRIAYDAAFAAAGIERTPAP